MGVMARKNVLAVLAMVLLLAAVAGVAAAEPNPGPLSPAGTVAYYSAPPRFQIYNAPGQYGGLLLVDTKTGVTYQRVIVATPKGVAIRWLKIDRFKSLAPGETIQWR